MDQSLINTELLRRLEQLQLIARRWAKSSLRGERQSRARGFSIEFADYRNYVAGDDLRYLDWGLYGRLDRLFLRLYEEERELPVTVFLDASESMGFGEPAKFLFARQIAAAVCHVALCGLDRVTVRFFPEKAENQRFGLPLRSVRGRQSSLRLLEHLSALVAGGESDFNEDLKRGVLEASHAGLAVVVSDLLSHTGCKGGLEALMARGFQVMVVQVLSPEEIQPTSFGDLKFVDAETGAVQEVTFGKYRLSRYQASATAYVDGLADFCRRRGIGFWSVSSASLLEDLLLKQLKEGGFWR
ncbi:MAG: hypothetical protein M2R45_04272 [Verrucomicrobia subdivision 3 bacterium]|nr:hypothetical protein [Limisphaerales bacterium]MCS1417379.1 hypothetical protein [Limisphaerales bacterium]